MTRHADDDVLPEDFRIHTVDEQGTLNYEFTTPRFHIMPGPSIKNPNPKDALAGSKIPLHLWPTSASLLGSLALLDGAGKYGRTNYRATPVKATVYYAACLRHLSLWFEGSDTDSDSGLPHLAHAIACIAILIDAKMAKSLIDDRVYPGDYQSLVDELTPLVNLINAGHAERTDVKHYDIRDKS